MNETCAKCRAPLPLAQPLLVVAREDAISLITIAFCDGCVATLSLAAAVALLDTTPSMSSGAD